MQSLLTHSRSLFTQRFAQKAFVIKNESWFQKWKKKKRSRRNSEIELNIFVYLFFVGIERMCEWNITTACVVPRALMRAPTLQEIISCLFHTGSHHHHRNFSEMSHWSRSRKSPLLISASDGSSGDYIWLSIFKTQAAATLQCKWRIGGFSSQSPLMSWF